jgi:hypothetical protein
MRTSTVRLCGYAVLNTGRGVFVTRERDQARACGADLAQALDNLRQGRLISPR